jgi:hypothetical protein
VLRLAGGQLGEATGTVAALGGAAITGDRDWEGTLGTAAGRTGSGHYTLTCPPLRRPSCGSARPLTPFWRNGTFNSSQVVMRYGGHLSDRRSLERRHI